VVDGLRQERFALEAGEARIVLEEDHPRVTQNERGALYSGQSAADPGLVRAGIVLHLLARREQIMPRRRRLGAANAVAPAKGRQRWVRDGGTEFGKRIVHAPEMPFIASMQLQDLLAPRFGQLRAHQRRHGGAAGADDATYRV